jgi:hypothetical protein
MQNTKTAQKARAGDFKNRAAAAELAGRALRGRR